MDRYWEKNAVTNAPAVPASNTGGYPTDGNASEGIDGTVPGAWWLHLITEELRNAILKLGGVPDWTKTDQLAQQLASLLDGSSITFRQDSPDSVNRPMIAKERDHVNLFDFGDETLIGNGQIIYSDDGVRTIAQVAFEKALAFCAANGRKLQISPGTYMVNGLDCSSPFIEGGNPRKVRIVGIDKTRPVMRVWGIADVRGIGISCSGFKPGVDAQPNYRVLEIGNSVTGAFLERQSKLDKLLLSNGHAGLYSGATCYADCFGDIEFTRLTRCADLNCTSSTSLKAGNWYADNWDVYPTTRMTSDIMFSFSGSFSELELPQISAEWCNVTNCVVLVNGADNVDIKTFHMEGLTAQGATAAFFKAISNPGAVRPMKLKIANGTIFNCDIPDPSKGWIFLFVQNGVQSIVENVSAYNNPNAGGTTMRFYRGGDLSALPSPTFRLANFVTDNFQTSDYVPVAAGYPAPVLEGTPYLDTGAPTGGTYASGTRISNRTPSVFGFSHWVKAADGGFQAFGPAYEDGDFSPILSGLGDSSYSVRAANFTRIGPRVFFDVTLFLSNNVGATGNFSVDLNDIPYSPANSKHGYSAITIGRLASLISGKPMMARMIAGSKTVLFEYGDGSGTVPASVIGPNSVVQISGWFRVI